MLLPSELIELEPVKRQAVINDENVSDSTREDNNLTTEKGNTNEECGKSNSTNEQGMVPYLGKNKNHLASIKENNLENIFIDEKLMHIPIKITNNKILEVYEKEIPLLAMEEINPLMSVRKANNLDHLHKCDKVIEVKVNEDQAFRFYEVEDDNGKVVYKTVVIESTDTLNKKIELEGEATLKDMNDFCWDNFEAYYKKEAKKALKAESGHKVRLDKTYFLF